MLYNLRSLTSTKLKKQNITSTTEADPVITANNGPSPALNYTNTLTSNTKG